MISGIPKCFQNDNIINTYGDHFVPTYDGRGVDISSQRQDQLDLSALNFIREKVARCNKVQVIELGGGCGAHSIQMAIEGAEVIMIDIADTAAENFHKFSKTERGNPERLHFIQKDFTSLKQEDIPENYDMLFSQRSIHYVPYEDAKKILQLLYGHMARNGVIFISAAGWDTEYGKTYPDRNRPVDQRFNFITPDMQEKPGIRHKITTYK